MTLLMMRVVLTGLILISSPAEEMIRQVDEVLRIIAREEETLRRELADLQELPAPRQPEEKRRREIEIRIHHLNGELLRLERELFEGKRRIFLLWDRGLLDREEVVKKETELAHSLAERKRTLQQERNEAHQQYQELEAQLHRKAHPGM